MLLFRKIWETHKLFVISQEALCDNQHLFYILTHFQPIFYCHIPTKRTKTHKNHRNWLHVAEITSLELHEVLWQQSTVINQTFLAHFQTMFHFYTSWKPPVFWCFHGDRSGTLVENGLLLHNSIGNLSPVNSTALINPFLTNVLPLYSLKNPPDVCRPVIIQFLVLVHQSWMKMGSCISFT